MSAGDHHNVSASLIQRSGEVDGQNKPGQPPCHQDFDEDHGHPEIGPSVIGWGSKLNVKDSTGPTESHTAALDERLSDVTQKAESSYEGMSDGSSTTPFELASSDGRKRGTGLRILTTLGVNLRSTDTSSTILSPGIPSSPTDNMLSSIRIEKTSLYTACQDGDIDIVKWKLCVGVDVNERNANQESPLDAVATNGMLEIAEVLIKSGAEVNSRDKYGWTPLHRASRFGRLGVVRLLLDVGADMNAKEQTQWSPLHLASANGYVEIVQLLLERGARIDAENDEGRTPSDEALRNGELEIAGVLLQYGVR